MKHLNFSLEEFVEVYVSESFKIVEEPIDEDRFYERLFYSLSKRFGIDKRSLLMVHHSLHWVLFCEKNAPFELVYDGGYDDGGGRVRVKEGFAGELCKVCQDVLERYGYYLRKRFERFIQ